MAKDGGVSTSVWHATTDFPEHHVLRQNETVDVCIVGAGLAGMTTAYLLAKKGKSVIVLDDGPVGGGETGRTTAHLASEIDDYYHEVERLHGLENARIAYDSQARAIDLIEQIVKNEEIDCDFERLDGYLFLPPGEDVKELDDEFEACKRVGIPCHKVPAAPFSTYPTGPALRFSDQGQFHPLKYLLGLERVCRSMGVRIYTGTHVVGFEGGSPAKVKTAGEVEVTCSAIVVATNTPVNDWVVMHTKQYPYRTYAMGFVVPDNSIPKALYWDTLDPYHYIRLHKEDDTSIMIVGGEDHKTGQEGEEKERWRTLEEWTRKHFPFAGEVRYRWSGQVMEPDDYLMYAGKNPMDAKNVYIITGDSGQGMTNTTCGAMIVSDLILGHENPWAKLYDPSRKTLTAEFLKENVNFVTQYKDWFTKGDVSSPDQIPNGEGAIIRQGLMKVAVYKTETGQVHTCSAVCPHLGCIVDWNRVEKTWDCPCHGSRFDAHGRVMNGPALADLAEFKLDAMPPQQSQQPGSARP